MTKEDRPDRPQSTRAFLIAGLVVAAFLLAGAYVSAYLTRGELWEFNSLIGIISAVPIDRSLGPVTFVREFRTQSEVILFTPAAKVESWVRGSEVVVSLQR